MIIAATLAILGAQPEVKIPHAGRAPESLIVLDMRKEKDFARRCLAASVQGLYNSEPRNSQKIFLLWDDADAKWAKWLPGHGYVRNGRSISSLSSLVKLAPTRSAVVYGTAPFHIANIATTVAGCERLLMVGDPKLLVEFGLKAKLDLSGKFKANSEAYDWLWKSYKNKINRSVSSITVPQPTKEHNPSQLRDYQIANRAFTFWVSGDKEAKFPGADAKAENEGNFKALHENVLPNTPVLGYPWSGDGYGLGEWDGVGFISKSGHFLIPTDNFGNLSVWSCFPQSKRTVARKAAAFSPKQGKRYCSIMMSDGDNACTFREFFPNYWKGLAGKDFPVGWTMAPLLRKLAPPVFDYSTKNIPQGDTVGSGVSGVGYASAELYDPSAVGGFMDLTRAECRAAGEDWLWIMRYGKPESATLKAYDRSGDWRVVLGGYGRVTENLSESLDRFGKTPVVHSILDAWNPADFDAKLAKFLADPSAPRAFSVFILNWNFTPKDLKEVARKLRAAGVEIVRPEELGDVVKSGW